VVSSAIHPTAGQNVPLTVVGGILLSADQQLGMEQLTIGSSPDLVDGLPRILAIVDMNSPGWAYRRVQIDKDGAGDVFSAAGLREESLERATLCLVLRIGVGTSIGLETMLEEIAGNGRQSVTLVAMNGVSYSSQALLPSWVPAWPMCRWQIC
jgi:hypothetical protein